MRLVPALTSSPPSTSATVDGASSFNQQLGGAWATSTANKNYMFCNCPGSIVKTPVVPLPASPTTTTAPTPSGSNFSFSFGGQPAQQPPRAPAPSAAAATSSFGFGTAGAGGTSGASTSFWRLHVTHHEPRLED